MAIVWHHGVISDHALIFNPEPVRIGALILKYHRGHFVPRYVASVVLSVDALYYRVTIHIE